MPQLRPVMVMDTATQNFGQKLAKNTVIIVIGTGKIYTTKTVIAANKNVSNSTANLTVIK